MLKNALSFNQNGFCNIVELKQFYFIARPLKEILPANDFSLLVSTSADKRYPRNIVIFEEGDAPKGIYILNKGKVKIFQRTLTGSQQIMNIHVAGEVIGYRPVLSDERYPVTAMTLEPCELTFIPKKHFAMVLSKSPSLSNTLLNYLSREFTVWINTISLHVNKSVRERLLLNLLILSVKYREGNEWPIRILLSKSNLAFLVGTSSETLARTLKILKDEKLVSARGRTLEISGPDQLKRLQKAVSFLK